MRISHFWPQNGPFVLNKIFLVQTIINTFIYLLALFIVQNFKNILPFLAITWEKIPDKSFKQIPDKTNNMIFLKSPKPQFLGHFSTIFGHFCRIGIFSKKSSSVTQLYIDP